MSSTTTSKSAEARAQVRLAELRSGVGTVEDVADFFAMSERQVINWKDDGEIGSSTKGRWVRFYPDDIADFGARQHRAGKYSTAAPSDVRTMIKSDWLRFLNAIADQNHQQRELEDLRKRVELLEAAFQIANHLKEAA